ncbi:MAG: hypothetical protein ACI88H_000176, partial [Cocleimonas sp.]
HFSAPCFVISSLPLIAALNEILFTLMAYMRVVDGDLLV